MRLTLRTLLAYLDDTLEPAEIKQIGQKVAESETAQELIARIKQVTRRRRLTAPPATGPGARFDANTVAEYLDSVLPAEQVAEVEKTCLESDVHLAEIAACHQILTLVLGEPVLVPPTAKRRMYALVRGREAVSRKPRPRMLAGSPGVQADGSEADETLLLGLPPLGHGKWMRWLVPAAAVLLVAALGVALWMALPSSPAPVVAHNHRPTGRERPAPPLAQPEDPGAVSEQIAQAAEAVSRAASAAARDTPNAGKQPGGTDRPAAGSIRAKITPPSTERRPVGQHILVSRPPNMLLHRQRGREDWQRLRLDSPVHTDDLLVSLPGFRSDIRLDNKVQLLLWGNVDQQLGFLGFPLYESAVVLHAVPNEPAGALDADFTLDRGRMTVSNPRDKPALVRVRFHDEVWDLTLDPGAEVGLELIGRSGGYKTGEEPQANLFLFVLKGSAQVEMNYHTVNLKAPPGSAVFMVWDKHAGRTLEPRLLPQVPREWSPVLPATWQWENFPASERKAFLEDYQDMQQALTELSQRLTSDKDKLDVVLAENRHKSRRGPRVLAILSRGAIDDLPKLLDALADEEHADVRETAVIALRHWLTRRDGQDQELLKALAEKRYTPNEAETVMQLLHSFSRDDQAKKETSEALIDFLTHDRPAIRQLAFWHLVRLAAAVPEARKIPLYNPSGGVKEREEIQKQWRKLLAEGKLPPRLPPPPPMPMPK